MRICGIPIFQISSFGILIIGHGISSVTSVETSPQTTPAYKHTLSSEYNYFSDILTSKLFIDKTELILKIVENDSPHHLFTAPSYFGKSTNLEMLMTYLELPIDWGTGAIISKERTYAYELFYASKINLTIVSYPEYYQRHFMEYLVIAIDFSDATSYDLYESSLSYENRTDKIITKIKSTLFDPIERYECVLEQSDSGRGLLQKLQAFKKSPPNRDLENELEHLFEFIDILRTSFPDKKVILLADEFHYWIEIALHLECDAEFVLETIENILLALLKSGRSTVDMSYICGISNVVRAEASSSLSETLISYPFLEGHRFESHFGVTDAELKCLCEKYNVSPKEEIAIKEYYAPYISKSGQKIYTLRFARSYFKDRKKHIQEPPVMKSFFTTEYVPSRMFSSCILENLVIRYNLMKLLLGYPVQTIISSKINLTEFNFLEQWFQNKEQVVDFELATTQNRLYFSLLLEIGLIAYNNDKNIVLPNIECTRIIEIIIKEYLWRQKSVSRDYLQHTRDALESITNETCPEKEKFMKLKKNFNDWFFSEEQFDARKKYDEKLVKFDYQCKIAQLLHPFVKLHNHSVELFINRTGSDEGFAGIVAMNADGSVVTIFEINFDRAEHRVENYFFRQDHATFRQIYLRKIVIDVIRQQNDTLISLLPTVLCNCVADMFNYLHSEQNYTLVI